ncbi:MAG: tetratricopeptide repeat protein [Candidatus Obscuribacterales bacterium]
MSKIYFKGIDLKAKYRLAFAPAFLALLQIVPAGVLPLGSTLVLAGISTELVISSCLPLPAEAKNSQKNTTDPALKNTKLGKQLFEKGDYDLAIDALLQATYFARNGYAPEAFYYLGKCYLAKGEYLKAYDSLKKHLSQNVSGDGWGNVAMVETLTALQRYDDAHPYVAFALAGATYESPIYRAAHVAAGKMEDAKGNFSAACDHYRSSLGDAPWTFFDGWIGFCECLMKMKKWTEAYKYLDQMLTTNQTVKGLNYERLHLDLGICLLAKGNHQGAIDHWHQCLEYNHDNKEAHLQLAMILESENHISSAIKEYRSFVRLSDDPKNHAPDKEMRSKQVETRIALLEEKLNAEAPPARAQMTPYMLMQEKKAEQDRIRQQQQEQQRLIEEQMKSLPKDAGF